MIKWELICYGVVAVLVVGYICLCKISSWRNWQMLQGFMPDIVENGDET